MHVQPGALHRALKALLRLTNKTAPNVLLEARHDALTLTATDGTSWLRTEIRCHGDLTACLPAEQFLRIVQPYRKAGWDILVTPGDEAVDVSCDSAQAIVPSSALASFPQQPVSDDPEIYAGMWEVDAFRDAMRFVVRAAGDDPTRPAMQGILVERERAVATDGCRLHTAKLLGLDGAPLLIPASAVNPLLKILPKEGMVSAALRGNRVVFRFGEWELDTGLIVAPFPPWRQVVPAPSAELFHAIVGRDQILDAFKRLPNPRKLRGLKISVNGVIRIEQSNDDGVASSTMIEPIASTHSGADFEIGLSRSYFTDAVVDAEANVVARFIGPLDPVVFTAEDRTAVVMPMRI